MKRQNGRGGNDAFQQLNDDEIQHEEARQPLSDEQLVQQIKETADKLIRDHCNRGDLKLLTTALKELRYAFKVFAPYRQHKKVTVFGSARMKLDHPAYLLAVDFCRRLASARYLVIQS